MLSPLLSPTCGNWPTKTTRFDDRLSLERARHGQKKNFHNIHYFHQLHKFSDNQHEREPWGQKADGPWATSEETAYPWPLARSIAAQVVLQLQSRGIVCHLPSFAEQEATFQAMRASTNIQPRKHLPSFVPEFKEVVHQDSQESLPANARFLSTPKRGYVASAKEVKEGQVTAGVHFSPEEFCSGSSPTGPSCGLPRHVVLRCLRWYR